MSCSIIVPVTDIISDGDKLLEALMFSIVSQNIHDRYSIVIAFDACKHPFIEYFLRRYPFIKPVVNAGNRLNFVGNSNNAIRKVLEDGGSSIILVNQDCVLPETKWLDILTQREGLAVPSPVKICQEPPITPEDLEKLAKSQPSEIQITRHNKLTGFCIFMSSEGLKKVGLMDPYFKASFDDDDLCVRYRLAGLPVEHVNFNVHHYESRCGAYDGNMLQLNLFKFRNKWAIPREVEHGEFPAWILANHKWHSEMRQE